jgi:hypothetical protein
MKHCAQPFLLDKVADGMTDKGYYYASNNYSSSGWERVHGRIEPGAIVLIRPDFSKRWPDAGSYLGTDERGDAAVAKLHFPGLHPDAARWLAEDRHVKAVGLDTASIDYGQSTLFESHRALYERNIPAFENLTALDQLPPRGAVVYALPMKITGGSGGPLRAIAAFRSSAGVSSRGDAGGQEANELAVRGNGRGGCRAARRLARGRAASDGLAAPQPRSDEQPLRAT